MIKAGMNPPAPFLHSTASYPDNNQYHHMHRDILETFDITIFITSTSPTSITIQVFEQRVTEQSLISMWTMQEATIHSTTAYLADNHTQVTFEAASASKGQPQGRHLRAPEHFPDDQIPPYRVRTYRGTSTSSCSENIYA
eukprot:scaffold286181_cov44-Attheya_sp.AAC.2